MDFPEMHQKQKVHFCLMDEKNCYNLDFCKVEKSRFLLAAYYADRKNFPYQKCKIHVRGISREEMGLFDKVLDMQIDPQIKSSFSNYFQTKLNPRERRLLTVAAGEYDENGVEKLDAPFLSSQLADEWINHSSDFARNHITPCFSDLVTYCKFAMIKESVKQETLKSSDSSVYVSGEMLYKNPPQVDMKICDGGGCLYLPFVEGLDEESFDGKEFPSHINLKGGIRIKWVQTCKDNEIGYCVLSKSANSSKNCIYSKLDIFKSMPLGMSYVKEIDHRGYILRSAWLSPDKKLLVTTSETDQGGSGLFLLTNFDDSKPEEFLLDVNPECLNGTGNFCFNHTSDVLACVQQEAIHFFDVKSKKIISSLPLGVSLMPTMSTEVRFNRDSSRFVFSLLIDSSCFVQIYDTSDLNNIKQIAFFSEDYLDRSSNLRINFSYANQETRAALENDGDLLDLIIISGSNITLFFDAQSGKFLSKKISKNGFFSKLRKESGIDHVATVPIPDSPATFIGIDHRNSSTVCLYNHSVGEEVGIITYPEPKLCAIGFTKNLASLIAIFKNRKTIKTDLFDDQKFKAILDGMRFVDWHILFQLYFAKKSQKKHNLPLSLVDYIKKIFNSGNMNNFIEDHFLSNEENSWLHYFGIIN